MIGIELVKAGTNEPNPAAFKFLSGYSRENRLLILNCGPDGNVIRFIPPLCVTEDELNLAIDTIDAAITAYESD